MKYTWFVFLMKKKKTSDLREETRLKVCGEQSVEENIWTYDRGRNWRLE
jgi:hypothetical protein